MQMTIGDMRREAWFILWKEHWFWRLFVASLLLEVIVFLIDQMAGGVCSHFQIPHWGEYLGQYLMARLGEGLLAVPSRETAWRMTAASGVLMLFGWLLEGCATFGKALVLSRASRGRVEGWSSGILSGFRAPFVHLVLQVIVLFSSYLVLGATAVVVGMATGGRCFTTVRGALMLASAAIVLHLVTRLYFLPLWLVRVAHPDWDVRACLTETRRVLKGQRGRLLGLSLGHPPLQMFLVAGMALACLPEAVLPLALLLVPVIVVLYLILAWHLFVATAILWRESVAARERLETNTCGIISA